MYRLGLILAATLWGALAQANCSEPASAARIEEATVRATEALSRADAGAYRSAHDEATSLIPCLDALVPVDLAAAVHRMGGVRAFLDRDLERAHLRFATARMLAPLYQWPDELLPPTHPIRSAYLELRLTGMRFDVPPPPRRGIVATDGRIGQGRLEGLPAIFQRIENDGSPTDSRMLEPMDDYPEYLHRQKRRVRPATIVAIGAVVASGLFYYAAVDARGTYNDLSTPYSELDGHRTRIVAFSVTSGVLLAAGTGSGIAAVIPRSRR
jgi:hypothetical protein